MVVLGGLFLIGEAQGGDFAPAPVHCPVLALTSLLLLYTTTAPSGQGAYSLLIPFGISCSILLNTPIVFELHSSACLLPLRPLRRRREG